MTREEKLLFVAACSLKEDPAACPIWWEERWEWGEGALDYVVARDQGAIVYPIARQVCRDESVFTAAEAAYRLAVTESRRQGTIGYVVARRDDRLYLYQATVPERAEPQYPEKTTGERVISDNPFANVLLSRHLEEIGFSARPHRPAPPLRSSALAERRLQVAG